MGPTRDQLAFELLKHRVEHHGPRSFEAAELDDLLSDCYAVADAFTARQEVGEVFEARLRKAEAQHDQVLADGVEAARKALVDAQDVAAKADSGKDHDDAVKAVDVAKTNLDAAVSKANDQWQHVADHPLRIQAEARRHLLATQANLAKSSSDLKARCERDVAIAVLLVEQADAEAKEFLDHGLAKLGHTTKARHPFKATQGEGGQRPGEGYGHKTSTESLPLQPTAPEPKPVHPTPTETKKAK